MQIHLLGQVEAVDGRAVALGGPTQRRLLAVLALRRNEVVSVARLAEAVWAERETPDSADHNVRTYVHRLRVALDGHGERIETIGAGYRMRLDSDEVDIGRFDRLAGTAMRLAETGELVDALDHIEEAERLWRGAPLEEFEHEAWAVPEVVRLTKLRVELRTQRARVLLELGRPSDAVAALTPVIREEPTGERPRALLMRALYESGQQVEALRAFRDFRRWLIDEVGVSPSDELVELDRAIARRDLAPLGGQRRTVPGYLLGERVGEGAFAVVHRATQTSLGREVAVKIIRAEVANEPAFIRWFEAEAQKVARVEHPNVVPLYDFWREPDRAFLVMRWMSGGSLADRLGDEPWSLDRTLTVVEQVAAGLDAAHQVGIVHGDVKPENILFDTDGRAYLGDFGIAQDTEAGCATAMEDAATSAAPGQQRGRHAGPETDVVALAAVAHRLLTGRVGSQVRHERVADVLALATSAQPMPRAPTAPGLAAALRAAAADVVAEVEVAPRPRVNPYKGLRAFDESDVADFHGRTQLVDELLDHLRQPDTRLLAVVGPSGSGKSSIVRAGLVPALRAGRLPGSSRWFFTSMVPGTRPFEALEAALLRVALNPPTALLEHLRDGERGIVRAMRRILPDDGTALTVVIDQFEELFSDEVPDHDRDAFLRALAVAATDRDSPARVVLTLRADHYDRPLRHADFAELLKQHTVAVTPLTPDELHEVIVAPAAAVGVRFGPGLVSTIVADVSRQPGGLPLLQHALTQMFDRADGQSIAADGYESIGGLAGAVARHAEQLWHETDAGERAALRRMFGRLVNLAGGTAGTPRRVALAELGCDDVVNRAVIERFASARLLTFDRDDSTREPTVEIAHEALIREWPRLRAWLDEDRDALRAQRHLGAAATGWIERGRDANELYRGARLETAESLRSTGAFALNADESEFLTASIQRRSTEAAAERQRLRRLRRLVTVTAIVAVLALVGGLLAYRQRGRAEQVAYDAETARLIATSGLLAPAKPRESLLLAVAAYQREQSPATLGALHASLAQAGPVVGHLGWGTEYVDVAAMPNGGIVGMRADGLDLFDRGSGMLLDSAEMEIGPGPYPDFSAPYRSASGGQHLVVALGSSVHLFAAGGRLEPLFEWSLPATVAAVDVSADGQTIVASSTDGTVAGWTATGEEAFGPLQLSLEANLTEQYDAHVELPFALEESGMRDFFANLPVWIVPAVHDDHIHLQVGAMSFSIDHDGRTLDPPVYTVVDLGDAGGLPAATRTVLHPEPGVTLMAGPISIGRVSTPTDPDATAALAVAEGTFGVGERPAISTLLDPDRRPASLLDDGTLVWFDPDTGERAASIDVGIGSALSAVTVDRGLLAVATQRGLAIVSIDGSGPLSHSVERQPDQAQLSISRDGRFAVLGGSALYPVPLTVYRRAADDGTYRALTDFPITAAVWAAAVPGHPRAGGDPLAVWGEIVGDEVSSSLFRLDTPDAPSLVSTAHVDGFTAGDIDPRQRWLVADSVDTQRVHVYDFQSGDVVTELPLPVTGEELTGIRFDPSGRRLLVSSSSGQSKLYDTETWTPRDDAVVAQRDIAVGYWNDDGSLLATAASDGQITIRDGETFEAIRHMAGPVATLNLGTGGPLIFSADDSLLITDHDNVARLWDVDSGQQIGVDMTTTDGTNSGINTGDELQLITGTPSSALIWNLDPDSWADIACRAAGSNLSPAEWDQWGARDEPHRTVCEQFPLAAR